VNIHRVYKTCLIAQLCMLIVLVASCSDEDCPTYSCPKSEIQYFPNSAGCVWTYEVLDSNDSSIDTLSISIARTVLINDSVVAAVYSSVSFCGFQECVAVSDSAVYSFRSELDSTPMLQYKLPFQLGDGWSHGLSHDTCWIAKTAEVQTRAGLFDESYMIWREHLPWGGSHYCSEWFAPYVGMVKLTTWSIASYPGASWHRSDWELIDYHVFP